MIDWGLRLTGHTDNGFEKRKKKKEKKKKIGEKENNGSSLAH
tara:strand:+ start:1566 stop:1691 length:126 start_codon:yes stop_codon:yes gene_type:complete